MRRNCWTKLRVEEESKKQQLAQPTHIFSRHHHPTPESGLFLEISTFYSAQQLTQRKKKKRNRDKSVRGEKKEICDYGQWDRHVT